VIFLKRQEPTGGLYVHIRIFLAAAIEKNTSQAFVSN
jgi:hypothetical protein